MATVNKKDIIAFSIENETVCRDCATDEEQEDATLDDLIVRQEQEQEDWLFCDRCKERIA